VQIRIQNTNVVPRLASHALTYRHKFSFSSLKYVTNPTETVCSYVIAKQRPFLTLYRRDVPTARKSKWSHPQPDQSLLTIPPLQTRLCFTIKDHQLSRIPTSPKIRDGVNPSVPAVSSQTQASLVSGNWRRLSSVRTTWTSGSACSDHVLIG
jgi:hypothetical protein